MKFKNGSKAGTKNKEEFADYQEVQSNLVHHLQERNLNFHFVMTCRNFNEWCNNLWDEIMDKLATEHLVRFYFLDETELYTTIISG